LRPLLPRHRLPWQSVQGLRGDESLRASTKLRTTDCTASRAASGERRPAFTQRTGPDGHGWARTSDLSRVKRGRQDGEIHRFSRVFTGSGDDCRGSEPIFVCRGFCRAWATESLRGPAGQRLDPIGNERWPGVGPVLGSRGKDRFALAMTSLRSVKRTRRSLDPASAPTPSWTFHDVGTATEQLMVRAAGRSQGCRYRRQAAAQAAEPRGRHWGSER
jgi:hypothetical protein